MFIRLIKSPPSGRRYVYLAESYRDAAGRNKQRLIERLGVLEDLEAVEPGVLDRLKAEARDATTAKAARVRLVEADLDAPFDGAIPINIGHLVASAVFDQLGVAGAVRSALPKSRADVAGVLRLLTLGHIVFAGSKAQTIARQGELFGLVEVSKDAAYRALDKIAEVAGAVQDEANRRITARFGRDARLVFYDVTNYFFTSDVETGMRRRGMSKQHQVTPIIQMGLFMDANGIPICYKLFDGNIPDCLTLAPAIEEAKTRFGLDKVIVVGDKAMNTGHNIAVLDQAGDGWIVSKSARGASQATKDWLLDPAGWTTDPTTGCKTKSKTATRQVTDHGKHCRTITEKIIARYSPVYAARDAHTRADMLRRAEAMVEDPTKYNASQTKGSKRYILHADPTTGEVLNPKDHQLTIDQARLDTDAEMDGYYMIHTSETTWSNQRICGHYHELWQIEETFRITKTDLKTRPIWVWTPQHIEAHFLICYIALTITRIIEHQTKHQHSAHTILTAIRQTTATHVGKDIYRLNRTSPINQIEQTLTATPLNHSWTTITDLRTHQHNLHKTTHKTLH